MDIPFEIKKGDIFRMTLFPEDGIIPKHEGESERNKYFVVLGMDDDRALVGSVLINSRINEHLFSRIAAQQYRITPDDYSFLTKEESYIDCYSIKEIAIERIRRDATHVDILKDEDYIEVRRLIRQSPVIAPIILKKFHLK